MNYEVILSRPAERALEHLPRDAQARVVSILRALRDDARPPGAAAMAEMHGAYRIRAGSIRVVYAVRDMELIVLVLAIADRSDVYSKREMSRIRRTLREWRARHSGQ